MGGCRTGSAVSKVLQVTGSPFTTLAIDPNYEVERYAELLDEMVQEGKFDYIGLSEVRAETIRRAHKVRSLFD